MCFSDAPKNLRVKAVYVRQQGPLISSIACKGWTSHGNNFLPSKIVSCMVRKHFCYVFRKATHKRTSALAMIQLVSSFLSLGPSFVLVGQVQNARAVKALGAVERK